MVPTKPSSPLSDYYASVKLSPVEHDIASAESFRLHENKRRNLFEHCLSLPFAVLRGARVLEFGPGSGENAVVAARHGATLTLVEPLDYLIEKLRHKFDQHGLAGAIHEIHHDTVENFKTDLTHDLVIAEGFIHFLDNPPAMIGKIAAFVAPGGFLILSVVHPVGTFVEVMKKFFLRLAIQATGAKGAAAEMKCAKSIFGEDFAKINHSRSFESWAGDTILNPLYNKKACLGLEEAMRELPPDFALYSSWPNYLNRDDMVWHKALKTRQQIRTATLDSYYARLPHFIDSKPRTQNEIEYFKVSEGRQTARLLEDCLQAMDDAIATKMAAEKVTATVKMLGDLAGFLDTASAGKRGAAILRSCVDLFNKGSSVRTLEEFAELYRTHGLLRQSWGSPGHYYVFQKTNLFSEDPNDL